MIPVGAIRMLDGPYRVFCKSERMKLVAERQSFLLDLGYEIVVIYVG